MGDIYSIKPAPKNASPKSSLDIKKATGGTYTGALDLSSMDWFTANWPLYQGTADAEKTASVEKLLTPQGGDYEDPYADSHPGIKGKRLSADLLESLLVIPGTRIFHGLRFPGAANGLVEINHIVVNANKVVIVDSKYWKGGDYLWSNDAEVLRYSSGKEDTFPIRTKEALTHYADLFKTAEVRAYSLVHSPAGQHQVFRNLYESESGETLRATTPLVTPKEFFEDVGTWLNDGADGRSYEAIFTQLTKDLKKTKKKTDSSADEAPVAKAEATSPKKNPPAPEKPASVKKGPPAPPSFKDRLKKMFS